MKKIYLLLSAAILSVACLTLTPTAEPTLETGIEPVATSDPAQPIEVQAEETFVIVLDTNPSTGYHWEVLGELIGAEFVSRDYIADQPVSPGSGGADVWTFKAVSAGQAQITFGNYPPSSEGGEAQQTVTFNIIVK
jgi:inhibitor of cysteine peptidase